METLQNKSITRDYKPLKLIKFLRKHPEGDGSPPRRVRNKTFRKPRPFSGGRSTQSTGGRLARARTSGTPIRGEPVSDSRHRSHDTRNRRPGNNTRERAASVLVTRLEVPRACRPVIERGAPPRARAPRPLRSLPSRLPPDPRGIPARGPRPGRFSRWSRRRRCNVS